MIVTRFAPSPTGHLHIGHAYAALVAYTKAQQAGGKFILRVEDIDPTRCKDVFIKAISEDLSWLGLRWEEPVYRQSEHIEQYVTILDQLRDRDLLYPCFCSRHEVILEARASGYAPHLTIAGNEAPFYAGTCRHLSVDERRRRMDERQAANWRLDVKKAFDLTGVLSWYEQGKGNIIARPLDFGDVVLARKDVPTSYHLSVTVDDYRQGISLVTRGDDLMNVTSIHRLLQALLGYPAPEYYHHPLLKDSSGRRYSKRDQSMTIRSLREKGLTAHEIYTLADFNNSF